MTRDERAASRLRWVRVLDWGARASVVLGGALLLNRSSAPAPVTPPGFVDSDPSGRGAPSIPPSTDARHAGHETEDMDARTMMFLVFGLGAAVALAIAGIVVLLGWFQHAREAAQPPFTAQQTAPATPPVPNLQADPQTDIVRLRAAENARLGGYGWLDPGHTRARIPIERAMSLMVGRSLDAPP